MKALKLIYSLLLLSVLGVIFGCQKDVEIPKATSVLLNSQELNLEPGNTFKFEVEVLPIENESVVEWKIEDEKIVSLENGLLTALSEGQTNVIVKVDEVSDTCKVNVSIPVPELEKITIDSEDFILKVEQTKQLNAELTPKELELEVSWKSSNEKVATVVNGLVSAKSAGSAIITAFIGDIEDKCAVSVEEPLVTINSVELDITNKEVFVGDTFTLTAIVDPEELEDKLVWSTSNSEVATVNNGLVTAISEGKAKIIASVHGEEAECDVIVKDGTVSISFEKNAYEVEEGESFNIIATVTPEEKAEQLVWISSDEEVATVTDNGYVTAKKQGTAKISASIGDVKAECSLTVVEATDIKITFDQKNRTIELGESSQVNATILPASAADRQITWKLKYESHYEFATISNEGLVSPIKEGNVVVVASVGDVEAECYVSIITSHDIKKEWTMYEHFNIEGYGEGIVINKSDTYIKVMAFEYSQQKWAIDEDIVVGNAEGAGYEKDGIKLTAAIGEKALENPGNFPLYDWVKSFGDKWYIPSSSELYDFCGFNRRKAIDEQLEALGKSPIPEDVWGAAELKAPFTNEAEFYSNPYVRSNPKTNKHWGVALLKIKFK